MSLESLIEESRKMAYEGADYLDIKKKMSLKAGSTENLNFIMLKADGFIAEYQLAHQERSKVINYILIGAFLLILGLGLTVYSYFISRSEFMLLYGAIIVGAYLVLKNLLILKKPIEDFIPQESKFRKRKKY